MDRLSSTMSRALLAVLLAACAPVLAPRTTKPVETAALPARLASAADRFFQSGDVRLRYRDIGQGAAVLLLHGWSRDLDDWQPVADSLAARHRVIALDWRGFGRSDKPTDPSRYGREMLDDVERLLDHLGIRQVHLVGHSMGATGAAAFAVRRPRRVRTLVLAAGAFQDSAALARRFAGWIEDLEHGRGMEWALARNDRGALIATLRNGPPSVSPAQASANRIPTLAIAGSQDFQVADTRRLADWWPGVRVVIVEGAGHGDLIARPAFLDDVRAHLRAR